MHFEAETRTLSTPAEVEGRPMLPTSPRLRFQFGSSKMPAYAPEEAADTSTLASRQLQYGASLWPAPSIVAAAGSPPVRESLALQTSAPPGLSVLRSSLPGSSTGLASHLQTVTSAPPSRFAYDAPAASRGPVGRPGKLSLPRLVGLPVSPPNSVGSLLRSRSVQEDSWTPSGHHGPPRPPSIPEAAASAPSSKRLSEEKVPFGTATTALGAAAVDPRLPQLPLLYSSPAVESAPSAALSLLAEASEKLPLHPGRKRSREPPIRPQDLPEKPAAGEPRRKVAQRMLQEIRASSVRLNPPVTGPPAPLAALQPQKTLMSGPLQFSDPMAPLARLAPSDVAAGNPNEAWQGATAATQPAPPADSALPSMGPLMPRRGSVDAARNAAIPLLAQETVARLPPLSSSLNSPLMQSKPVIVSGSDRGASRASRPAIESHLPVVSAQVYPASSCALPADPVAGPEATPLAARQLSSGPTQSTTPAAPGSPEARDTREPKASGDEAQVLWLCDRCDRPYKWKQTLQAHRRYVRRVLDGCVGQLRRVR